MELKSWEARTPRSVVAYHASLVFAKMTTPEAPSGFTNVKQQKDRKGADFVVGSHP